MPVARMCSKHRSTNISLQLLFTSDVATPHAIARFSWCGASSNIICSQGIIGSATHIELARRNLPRSEWVDSMIVACRDDVTCGQDVQPGLCGCTPWPITVAFFRHRRPIIRYRCLCCHEHVVCPCLARTHGRAVELGHGGTGAHDSRRHCCCRLCGHGYCECTSIAAWRGHAAGQWPLLPGNCWCTMWRRCAAWQSSSITGSASRVSAAALRPLAVLLRATRRRDASARCCGRRSPVTC